MAGQSIVASKDRANFNYYGDSREVMSNEEGLGKIFDLNTILLVIVYITLIACFGGIFYQIHNLTAAIDRQSINITEYQAPISFNESTIEKTEKKVKK